MNGIETKIARLEEKLEAAKEALQLQSREYNRRLDLLNGEAERLRQMQATYLPREAFNIIYEKMSKDIDDLQGFKNNAIGKQSIITIIVSAAISVAVLFIKSLF
jgi:hypothetical protein